MLPLQCGVQVRMTGDLKLDFVRGDNEVKASVAFQACSLQQTMTRRDHFKGV